MEEGRGGFFGLVRGLFRAGTLRERVGVMSRLAEKLQAESVGDAERAGVSQYDLHCGSHFLSLSSSTAGGAVWGH